MKLRQSIETKSKIWEKKIAQANQEAGLLLTRDYLRWKCRNDLFFLGKFTGHNLLLDPFHREMCETVSLMNWQLVRYGIMPAHPDMLRIEDVVDNPAELGKPQRLFLYFRSAFKTTIVTSLHTIQLLLNFPEIHVAICHNSQINASDILIGIRELFRTTKLQNIFEEYIPLEKDWGNQTGFSAACRKDYVMKGDSIEAIGINTKITGRKYHVFKVDDVVDETTVSNDEQLRQSRDFIQMHRNLFVIPAIPIEDYSGTKYHFADAYAMLEENSNVQTFKVPLLKEDDSGRITWEGKQYKCIVEELFQRTGIPEALQKGIEGLMENTYIFNCQQMLNPQDPKKVRFTKNMIQTYTHIPDGLNYYLLVDPADSEEKRACYTAMKVIGVDYDDNWYWVDGLFDKIDDRERIDEAIELALKWRVFEVLWENISFGRTDARNFERERRKHPSLNQSQVREIPASRVSKDDRILGLNDRYSRHKVFWPPSMMKYSQFEGKNIDLVKAQEYEFLGFPLVSHKDLLDAESFMLQIDLIKGDKQAMVEKSRFAQISDPVQRGNTERFWHDWDIWKENDFASPNEILMMDNL